jgi:hypothetical protein
MEVRASLRQVRMAEHFQHVKNRPATLKPSITAASRADIDSRRERPVFLAPPSTARMNSVLQTKFKSAH